VKHRDDKPWTLWLCQQFAIENDHLYPFIVDFPMKNGGSFHSFLYVYQRVPSLLIVRPDYVPFERWHYQQHGRSGGEGLRKSMGVAA